MKVTTTMHHPTIQELPSPPPGRTGWPWTEASPQLPDTMPDGSPWQRISIVTPSYNQGQFIEETIRSVLLQGYPNLEYIIMDGGSNDESVEIIRKYEPWLAYWVSQSDEGQADAINQGFSRSTGGILGWLNSDDLLCPRALSRIASAYHNDTSLNVTCGFRKLINQKSKITGNWVYGKPTAFVLKRLCFIAQETVYWRREVWEQVGSLDASFKFAMDYEYWQRMLAAGYRFELLPYYLGCFRLHPMSKNSVAGKVRERELRIIYERYLHRTDSEEVMCAEINLGWYIQRQLLRMIACIGILDCPWLALKVIKIM